MVRPEKTNRGHINATSLFYCTIIEHYRKKQPPGPGIKPHDIIYPSNTPLFYSLRHIRICGLALLDSKVLTLKCINTRESPEGGCLSFFSHVIFFFGRQTDSSVPVLHLLHAGAQPELLLILG